MPEAFDPYHTWLGIAHDEQPANHYRLLGISRFETDPEVIDNAADRQMAHLRSYQTGRHQKDSQQLLNEVAAARLCLLKPATKAAYDSKLRAELLAQARRPADSATSPSVPTAATLSKPAPAIVVPRQPARPMGAQTGVPVGGQTAGEPARPASVLPTEEVWNNLLGDVGPSSKIGKASATGKNSATKLAAEKRRKMLFVAAPAAALLLIGVIAAGVILSNQSASSSVEPGSHKIAGARPALSESNVASGSNVSRPIVVQPPSIPSQPSATVPLVIDWPLSERHGAELKIDDRVQQPGAAAKFEVPLERGLHSVRFNRPGFDEIVQSISIGGAEQQTVRPIWRTDDGTGLRAELFRGAQFDERVKSRVDPVIDFMWGFGPPDLDLPHENFSIRWSGFLKAPKPGKYKLIAVADDHAKVSLDGAVCLESTANLGRCEAMLDLTGEPQPLEVEFVQTADSATVSLRWVPPGHAQEQVIPAAALFYDKRVAEKATVRDVPDPAATGGLRAQLFDDAELQHIVKTRVDRQVDFLWGFDPPDPELRQENFSIRWDGVLQPPEAGRYTIAAVADDGVRVWLDDVLAVDDWKNHPATRTEAQLDLDKRPYRIRVEYFQGGSSAVCSLRWIRPGETRDEAIPSSALRPPGVSRVAQARSPFEPDVFPKGQWGDLLALVDPARDAIGGTWTRNGKEISCRAEGAGKLEIPVTIEGSYDLAVDFTRTEGKSDVQTMIPIDWWRCGVILSGWQGAASGLESVGGHHADEPDNPNSRRPGTLENGHRYKLLVSVRMLPEDQAGIDVSLDGAPYLAHWEGKRSSAEIHPFWTVLDLKRVALGVLDGQVTYHSAQLRVVSGQAVPASAATLRRTRLVGNSGNAPFQDLVPSGARLVGFRAATGVAEGVSATPVVHRIQSLYRTAKGVQPGTIHGGLDGDESEVVAKDGYAVGSLICRSGSIVDGFKVVFMRVRGDRLDPTDSYESPWVGGDGGNGPFQLGCGAGFVIGMSGSASNVLQSLSLIVQDRLPSAPADKKAP